MLFAAGTAPDFKVVPIGKELPARPSDKHKHGVRFSIKLSKDCGGDKPIREIAGTSKAFLSGIEAVYTQYLAEKDKHPGKLPVIVLEKTTPVRSGTGEHSSTNYHPTFKIVGWAPRGDLGGVAAPPVSLTAPRLPPARRRSKRRRLTKPSAPTTSASAVGPGRLQPTWPLHH